MNEEHFGEIERVLLFIGEARRRAEKSAKQIERDGAEVHLVEALRKAERELDQLHTLLMQRTFFAIPKDASQLSIAE